MRKTVFWTVLLCLGISAAAFAGQQPARPAVIRATWNAGPGDAVGIYGADFVRGGEETQVLLFPLRDSWGQEQAVMEHRALRILNMDEGVIQAEIPEDIPADQYLCFVKTGTQFSSPFTINTPEADWLSDPEFCAGQTVRLFGRNFLHPGDPDGTQTAVWLRDTETQTELPAEVQSVTPYTVDFTVPNSAVPGRIYTIRVQAGKSAYGSAVLPAIEAAECVEDTNFQDVKQQYGVELGWSAGLNMVNSFNVRDYGAKGDGTTDDTTAVQAALAAAKAASGGKIYFPEGTYNLTGLSKGIAIPEHTVLAGDGQERSVLQINQRISGAAGYSGISGLTVRSELLRPADNTARLIAGYVGSLVFAGGPEARFFMQDVGVYAADGSSFASYENKQIVIENCRFDITHQGPMIYNENLYTPVRLRFRNNYVRNTQRSMIWCGGHSWIDGCTFAGDNGGENCEKGENGHAATMEHRISEMWGDKVYYGNNLVTGTIGDQRLGFDDNSGEGVCNQATCIIALDRVSAADARTVTGVTDFDAVQAGEDPVAGKRGKRLIGAKIAVISGRGLGQVRRVAAASGNTLTLDAPWTVVPAAGDVFTVDGSMAERYIIVNNRIEAKTRKGGIMLYNKSYDNIIENNILTNSGGIWFGKAQEASQNRSAFAYFNYVGGNQLSGGVQYKEGGARDGALSIGTGDDGGVVLTSDRNINAVSQFANLYRDNTIQGNGTDLAPKSEYNGNFVRYNGFVVSTPDSGAGTAPLSRGLILDGNTAVGSVNGVTLSNTANRTLLYKNNFTGNGTDYHDYFSQNTVLVDGEGNAQAWAGPAYDLQETAAAETGETVGRVFQSAPVRIGEQRYLYVAGSSGLLIYCLTDGARLIQQVQGPLVSQYCYALEVHSGRLYYGVNASGVRRLYIYTLQPDGRINPDGPAQEIGITMTDFQIAGDYLVVCQASNGAAVYDAETCKKLTAFAGGTAVRSLKLERLDAERYRIYYITQTPYTEEADGVAYTCNETFHIAELKNGAVTPLFSGRPMGGPWPGFGAYQEIAGLSANWGRITLLDTNIIQLNPENKDFGHQSLVIDARTPQAPVLLAAYPNTEALRDMVPLKPHVFASLSVKGDMQVWDYSDPQNRKECMAVKHAWMRSGKDIDLMGNQIYVMSDSGFVVYTIVDNLGTTVSAPCLDYRQEGYTPGEYAVYCETAAAQAGELRVAAAEYRADNTLAAVQCQDFSVPAGNSGLLFRFTAQGGTRMKLLFWSDMLPLREAASFYP